MELCLMLKFVFHVLFFYPCDNYGHCNRVLCFCPVNNFGLRMVNIWRDVRNDKFTNMQLMRRTFFACIGLALKRVVANLLMISY